MSDPTVSDIGVSSVLGAPKRRVRQGRRLRAAVAWPTMTRLNDAERLCVAEALAVLERQPRGQEAFTSCRDVAAWLRLHYALLDREVFGVLLLDARHRLLGHEQIFFGSLDGASVHPREVVRVALSKNAAAVIAVHCHPSGVAEPSCADQRATERLRAALALIDVRLLDHVVVGGRDVVSMAERGLM